jgi:serine/threonine protein kinase/Tol biopolymer transport system component
MSLAPGTRIGPYEIVSIVGAGGMGEVYRARDPKLNRDVALKTLPPLVATDADRLARFKREAQVLASLNHAHIAAIYGLEEAAGVQALVLELVEGPTLADRIAQGSIPVEEALAIATQIAEALEAAHARGIVHRDLKPANIKVRADGSVKVLDFGLAKAIASDGATAEGSVTATITSPALTLLGVILGTAAYMSPEQARGKEADKRSDIWAFGCVLFEMLAGKRPFEASEVTDTLASILKSEPNWSALPADMPSGIRRVLRRCLEKDPRRRFHDIADVRLGFEDALSPDLTPTVRAVRSEGRRRERIAWSLVAVLLLFLGGHIAYVARKSAQAVQITRFQVYPPANMALRTQLGGASRATVSPDGTRLVFAAVDRAGRSQLWIRAFDSFDALPLTGTDGASLPFWSPDSRWVGFFVGGKLRKVDAAGGSPQTICDVESLPRGATWGSGGDIVFSSGGASRLYRVSDQGGRPVHLSIGPEQMLSEPAWPEFLPDGRTFLYWSRNATEGASVYARSLEPEAAPKKLLTSDSQAAYDPSGFLLFMRSGLLLRQPFDGARLDVSGEPTTVVEGVASLPVIGGALFSVSTNGVLTFQPESDLTSQFTWVDRAGNVLETVGDPGKYRYPHLSPDGQRLTYVNADGNVWILDIKRQISSKLTSGGTAVSPVWSNDGRSIFYRKTPAKNIPGGFYEKSASGAAEETLFFEGRLNGPSQISKDAKWLLYFAVPEGDSVQDVFALPMTGDRKPERIVQSPSADVEPQLSPDGKLLAYGSNPTGGRLEVFVEPFPRTGERWQLSNSGGRQPLWREDGKELFFVSDVDRKFYAVAIKPGPRFDYDPPKFLFEMRANVYATRNSYIPSPDGNRFLVNMTVDSTAPPIHVMRNWTAALRN